jgi:predicted lysophospholipase L1 biosynthesis ABC-type transport system permease subunit
LSVILASIAVAMAARRHSTRHLDGSAVMRCLGASQRTLVAVHLGELLWLGLIACTVGVAIAFALQWAVGGWLSRTLDIAIPAASVLPAVQGYAVGLVVLLAFGAPPVLALRRVPALRVLRPRSRPHRTERMARRHHRPGGAGRVVVVEGGLTDARPRQCSWASPSPSPCSPSSRGR